MTQKYMKKSDREKKIGKNFIETLTLLYISG